MAEFLEVTAAWEGGYRSLVSARGHEIQVDEPESAGGQNSGHDADRGALRGRGELLLPGAWRTWPASASLELPGLRVTARAERAGSELRYGRLVVEAGADVPDERLAKLIEPARRCCWVSNTLAGELELEYRYTPVDARSPE